MQRFEFHNFHKTRNETVNLFISDYHPRCMRNEAIFISNLWCNMLFMKLVMGWRYWVLHSYFSVMLMRICSFSYSCGRGLFDDLHFWAVFKEGRSRQATQWILLFSPLSGFGVDNSLSKKRRHKGTTSKVSPAFLVQEQCAAIINQGLLILPSSNPRNGNICFFLAEQTMLIIE